MSLAKQMQTQGGKPNGFLGFIIGNLMNFFHQDVHRWGLVDITIEDGFICLDIGCGGGNTVKTLSSKLKTGKVYGLDHSIEMVNLSRRINRSQLAKGLVEIELGSVSNLSYSNDHFDIVTAFETIQFWPNIKKNLMEVMRVLKSSGILVIVNRYPPENSKWSNFLKLKNENDYKDMLISSGFRKINFEKKKRKGWLKVVAHP